MATKQTPVEKFQKAVRGNKHGYEILKHFPQKIRRQIIENVIKDEGYDWLENMLYVFGYTNGKGFLGGAFRWDKSKEGSSYWAQIEREYEL